MSTHTSHANIRGISYLEMLVVISMIGIFSTLVFESLRTYSGSQGFYRAQARARSIADRIMETMVHDGNRALRVCRDDVEGNAYLTMMDFAPFTPLTGSKLPVEGHYGYLTRDEESLRETGNTALMVCAGAPLSAQINSKRVRFDRVTFVAYYLWRDSEGMVDIVRWESTPFARYQEMAALDNDADRAVAAAVMSQVGITLAWDSSEGATNLFYTIDGSGRLMAVTSGFKIPANPNIDNGGMAGEANYQIAPNGLDIPIEVPFYARLEADFPHGFEIKTDGDGTGCLIALRLVLKGRRNNSYAEAGQLLMVREE